MKARTITGRVFLVLGATLMFLLSATLAWAVVTDYQSRGLVTQGVSVAGHDLSGMTEEQARATIEDVVSTPMLRPVTITGDGKTWTLNPQGIVQVDVDAMLDQAYSPRRTASFLTRVSHQLTSEPLPAEIHLVYSVDTTPIAQWVAQTAQQVDRKPVNATRKLVKYAFKITPSVKGAKVNQASAVDEIAQSLLPSAALTATDRVVALPIATLKPKTVESDFKLAITVSLSQTKIRLYNGAKLIRAYTCAPGQPAWPTPTGNFKVISKQANAPWINPHDSWSASMPDVIPGGPDNPMGDRKIGINYPGVFFHGVPPGEYGSIGTHASHGCMRMMPSEVHDLYGRVKIGTPVYIRE